MTEAQVRKEFAEEEEAWLMVSGETQHVTSASAFVVLGLELEDSQ
jgi:hypothetical protein